MQHFGFFSSLRRAVPLEGVAGRHHLLIGLAISLLVHLGVLAWPFVARTRPSPTVQALEIVLVNTRTDSAPVQAQVQAQNQIDGGGEATRGIATTTLPWTASSADSVVLQAMRKRQAQLEVEQMQRLAQLKSRQRIRTERQPVHPWPDAAAPGDNDENQDSVIRNAQIAALTERIEAYNARPRKQFVGPAAEASRYAAYLDAWRSRIEAVGTRYYPDEARGRIYGSLRLSVSVRADGTVTDVEIDQPSPHAVLNQAARRIVRLAAPFPPFPPDIARDTDVLVITRTWNFTNDKLDTRAP